jgi:hypothetical protein
MAALGFQYADPAMAACRVTKAAFEKISIGMATPDEVEKMAGCSGVLDTSITTPRTHPPSCGIRAERTTCR